MRANREVVVAKLKQLQTECIPILTVIENQGLVKQLRADKLFTAQHLEENYGVSKLELVIPFHSFILSMCPHCIHARGGE